METGHNNNSTRDASWNICVMEAEDYEQIYALWTKIKGLGIRTLDDSKESIIRFIQRNPTTSFVATVEDCIVGTVLCGHDGRRGCFYHVCVEENYRHQGLATAMTKRALKALRAEHINKVNLMAFVDNRSGNALWRELNWVLREDVNLYELDLNNDNSTFFIK